MKLTPREIIACYLLDRADQYVTDSASWVGLADAAHNVMNDEHIRSYNEGEFDDSRLVARVRSFRGQAPKPVNPREGLDEPTQTAEEE